MRRLVWALPGIIAVLFTVSLASAAPSTAVQAGQSTMNEQQAMRYAPLTKPPPSIWRGVKWAGKRFGVEPELLASVYFTAQQRWVGPRHCPTTRYGCWPAVAAVWPQNAIVGYGNSRAFKDGALATSYFFYSNRARGYSSVRDLLSQLYSSAAVNRYGQLPQGLPWYSSAQAVRINLRLYQGLMRIMHRPRHVPS